MDAFQEIVEFRDIKIHQYPIDDLLAKFQVSSEKGLSRDNSLQRRELHGPNSIAAPIDCPGWVCCLLPFIGNTVTMRLFKESCPRTTLVMRNGKMLMMDSIALVPGDIVSLSGGDIVPADCRILKCSSNFEVDIQVFFDNLQLKKQEASNAESAEKNPLSSKNMLFMATEITHGDAIAIVTSTGEDTVWDQLIRAKRWPPENQEKTDLIN